jgi:uncharacterized Fe-S cluster-containing radical SAM superfamily protein
MYDAVKRHLAMEKMVMLGERRKYWRSRVDRWYGGIVSLDVVGCGLLCKFCWVRDDVLYRPGKIGEYLGPEEVARRLLNLSRSSGIRQMRVTGGEPTIGKSHLLRVLDLLEGKGIQFILETNGILIGYDEDYAKDLADYDFIHVRVSLKGCNEEEFTLLTGAKPEGFHLQLKALENLVKANVSCHPACMVSFSSKESREALLNRLGPLAEEFEVEELILYPRVKRRLDFYGLRYLAAYHPSGVPDELV